VKKIADRVRFCRKLKPVGGSEELNLAACELIVELEYPPPDVDAE
jgi:hypothetical protein